jgi:hypothetical protein
MDAERASQPVGVTVMQVSETPECAASTMMEELILRQASSSQPVVMPPTTASSVPTLSPLNKRVTPQTLDRPAAAVALLRRTPWNRKPVAPTKRRPTISYACP